VTGIQNPGVRKGPDKEANDRERQAESGLHHRRKIARCGNGATAPVAHTDFFTADGQFGSRDENAQQVDEGDYRPVAPDVVTFPSAARDFGDSGTINVQYVVAGNEAMFNVQVPRDCIKDPKCTDAFGWALSAFFAGPSWVRG